MSDNAIEKILYDFGAQCANEKVVAERFIEEAAQQLRQFILDVIGEEEPVKELEGKSMMHNELAYKNKIQNELRAEQRRKLK